MSEQEINHLSAAIQGKLQELTALIDKLDAGEQTALIIELKRISKLASKPVDDFEKSIKKVVDMSTDYQFTNQNWKFWYKISNRKLFNQEKALDTLSMLKYNTDDFYKITEAKTLLYERLQ